MQTFPIMGSVSKGWAAFARFSAGRFGAWAIVAVILAAAAIIRALYFIGFALGDDLTYFFMSRSMLNGQWPVYSYLNQYAYRPLLLLSLAGSFRLFGISDFSFIFPVLAASLLGIVIAFVLGRMLFNTQTGLIAALLLAVMPASVFNSVTFDNDVIVATTMGIVMLWYAQAREAEGRWQAALFASAGFMLVIAYLFKMTALFLLGVTAAISVADFFSRKRSAAAVWFYGSFAFFFGLVLCFYKFKTGEFLWHFQAERVYYETHIPDFYMSGTYNLYGMLIQYPLHLFSLLHIDGAVFLEFGLYAYFFAAAAAFVLWREQKRTPACILLWWVIVLFAVLEFLPSNMHPWYLPIPRQERYLEIIALPMAVIIARGLWLLARRHRAWAAALFAVLAVHACINTHARCSLVQDSIADLKLVAQWLCEHHAGEVYVDEPALSQLVFRTSACGTRVVRFDELKKGPPAKGAYVISGGSRIYLWALQFIRCVEDENLGFPLTPVLSYPPPRSPRSKGALVLYRYDG